MKTEYSEVTRILGCESITDAELEDHFDELCDYYMSSGDMPYGIAKARTGDPYQWMYDRLWNLGVLTD